MEQLKQYNEVEEIYLFGSCSRNEEKYFSDVDILVFLNISHEQQYFKLYRQLRSLAPDTISVPEADIQVYFNDTTINDFDELTFFEKMIKKDCILLYNGVNSDYYNNILKEVTYDNI